MIVPGSNFILLVCYKNNLLNVRWKGYITQYNPLHSWESPSVHISTWYTNFPTRHDHNATMYRIMQPCGTHSGPRVFPNCDIGLSHRKQLLVSLHQVHKHQWSLIEVGLYLINAIHFCLYCISFTTEHNLHLTPLSEMIAQSSLTFVINYSVLLIDWLIKINQGDCKREEDRDRDTD